MIRLGLFGVRAAASTSARHLVSRRRTSTSPYRRWATTIATSSSDEGPAVTATNRAETSLKRFWKTVNVEKHEEEQGEQGHGFSYSVTLDNRPLKTPSGNKLRIPHDKHLVAALIAVEWENQETLLKPHALPMTSIASRAIDAMTDDKTRSEVRAALLKYLDTDTICFYQDYPQTLVDLQKTHWDPILTWARKTYDVEIFTFNSIFTKPQPADTLAKFDYVLNTLDSWQMAALERATYASKSFLLALALVTRHISVEQAALASTVEVSSQIQKWGEVEDSHDVDYHDIRRQLASAACVLSQI